MAYGAAARNRLILNYDVEDSVVLQAEVRTLLSRALQIDPWDAMALLASGVAADIEGNHELAVRRVKEAVEVNPNSAYAWGTLAHVTRRAGDFTAALEASETALGLSPRDDGLSLFLLQRTAALYYLGRFDLCVDAGREATAADRPFPGAYMFLAAALIELGLVEEGGRSVAELRQKFPSFKGGTTKVVASTHDTTPAAPLDVISSAGFAI